MTSENFSIDFEVPNAPIVSEITGLSGEDITYVNAQEIKDSAGVTITGTGEAFAELSVLFSDGFERVTLPEGESLNKTTVNEDGEWSFIISEDDINGTSFGNGTKSFSVSQADAVGNISQSSSNTVFKLDTISPEVALSLDVVELSNNVNAKLNLVFSKIPIGFSSSDINSENVDIESLSIIEGTNGLEYSADLIPKANLYSSENVVKIGVDWTDAAGNTPESIIISEDFSIDTQSPIASVSLLEPNLESGDSSVVTVQFSEKPIGLDLSDFSAQGGVLSDLTANSLGLVYTATFTANEAMSDTNGIITLGTTWTDSFGNAPINVIESTSGEVINSAPFFTSEVNTNALEDAFYSYQLAANDFNASDDLSYSLLTNPSWLSINENTSVLSGTPTNDDVGSHAVVVRVSDEEGLFAEQNFYVEVANTNDIPVFSSEATTIPLIDATPLSVIYNASASDVDGDVLTYSIVDSLNIDVSGEGADGLINIALFDEVAPLHTARLGTLADDGAYDNVAFHRVIDGFMAQTGDVQYGAMDGNLIYAGRGGSTYEDLDEEFSDIPFDRGIVGMARSSDPDSANSQFFMMFEDIYSLNGNYTVVGEVASGLDVLYSIKRGDASQNGVVSQSPDYMEEVTYTPATDIFEINSTSGEITFINEPNFSNMDFKDLVVAVSDGSETVYKTVTLDLPPQNITISFSDINSVKSQLPDNNLVFKGGNDTTFAVENGKLGLLNQTITFSSIELENQNYNKGISLSDAILQLEHIVNLETLTGAQAVAADVNGDGNISLSDAIMTLEHIVNLSQITNCNFLDQSGEIVTELTPSTTIDLTLVQSGDVNLSATYVDLI